LSTDPNKTVKTAKKIQGNFMNKLSSAKQSSRILDEVKYLELILDKGLIWKKKPDKVTN
jgi:hypothetical protein